MAFDDLEVEHRFPVIGLKRMLLNARRIERNELPQLILLSFEDLTPQDIELTGLRATIAKLETRIEEMKSSYEKEQKANSEG